MDFDDGQREEMDERSRMGIMTMDTSGFVCLFVVVLQWRCTSWKHA